MPKEQRIKSLVAICEEIAHGNYERANALFEMTVKGNTCSEIATLAEAFGLMLVQLEAREYKLSETVEELKSAKEELERRSYRLDQENRLLRKVAKSQFSARSILGVSPGIRELVQTLERISDTPVSVLVGGETGTGKELVAKALHFDSRRSEKPFVAINCTSIPETIFEAEMFGIEKGVATGVDKRIGLIELADGGTLFLDEIGDMPLAAQSKVLRVLEERSLEGVGGRKSIPVDIRIIAATNKDLRHLVASGTFREDLFYRLNVVNLRIPPLRERPDDIAILATHHLELAAMKFGRPKPQLAEETMALLKSYSWPGNVRELENEMERAVVLSISETVFPEDLSEPIRQSIYHPAVAGGGGDGVRQTEFDLISSTLAKAGNNKSKAARMLGITREGLRKKIKRLGLTV